MLVAGRSSFSAYTVPAVARVREEGERAFVTLRVEGKPDIEVAMKRDGDRWRVVLRL
jgi:hypothetical protein